MCSYVAPVRFDRVRSSVVGEVQTLDCVELPTAYRCLFTLENRFFGVLLCMVFGVDFAAFVVATASIHNHNC